MNIKLLKFRVWDGNSLIYADAAQRLMNDNGGHPYLAFYLSQYFKIDINFVIQEYTGFRDKTGKMVYEGDLITVRLQIYKVIYSHGAFGIQNIRNEVDTTCFHLMSQHQQPLVWRVIGDGCGS